MYKPRPVWAIDQEDVLGIGWGIFHAGKIGVRLPGSQANRPVPCPDQAPAPLR